MTEISGECSDYRRLFCGEALRPQVALGKKEEVKGVIEHSDIEKWYDV